MSSSQDSFQNWVLRNSTHVAQIAASSGNTDPSRGLFNGFLTQNNWWLVWDIWRGVNEDASFCSLYCELLLDESIRQALDKIVDTVVRLSVHSQIDSTKCTYVKRPEISLQRSPNQQSGVPTVHYSHWCFILLTWGVWSCPAATGRAVVAADLIAAEDGVTPPNKLSSFIHDQNIRPSQFLNSLDWLPPSLIRTFSFFYS